MMRRTGRRERAGLNGAVGLAVPAVLGGLVLVLLASSAVADRARETDPKGDAFPPFTDIRAVRHGHAPRGVLRHVIVAQRANAATKTLAQVEVADGRNRYFITSRGVTRIRSGASGVEANDARTGGVSAVRRGNRIILSFHRSLIGNPRRYVWSATIGSNDTSPAEFDRAPDRGAITHRLRRPPRFVGYREGPEGKPDTVSVQGDLHRFAFVDRRRRRTAYRLVLDGPGDAIKRYRGRTNRRGRDAIEASRYVNDRGGPGGWRAIWRVGKRSVASFRFRVRPEPEG